MFIHRARGKSRTISKILPQKFAAHPLPLSPSFVFFRPSCSGFYFIFVPWKRDNLISHRAREQIKFNFADCCMQNVKLSEYVNGRAHDGRSTFSSARYKKWAPEYVHDFQLPGKDAIVLRVRCTIKKCLHFPVQFTSHVPLLKCFKLYEFDNSLSRGANYQNISMFLQLGYGDVCVKNLIFFHDRIYE